jgi:hypothetical protein
MSTTNPTAQRICIWCGIAFAVLFLVAFLIAGFIPPPSPSLGADQIAAIFRERTQSIRLGGILMSLGAVLIFPWVSAISVQMKRIEGPSSPFTYTQLISGGVGVLLFITPIIVLQTAAYRPELRSPETTLVLNDLAWLYFVGTPFLACIQNTSIGIAVLLDKRTVPVLPRWVGYFNLWTALGFAPGIVIPFFKSGPLAWTGVFAWWIPLTLFGLWIVVMVVMLLKAVKAQELEESHSSLSPA